MEAISHITQHQDQKTYQKSNVTNVTNLDTMQETVLRKLTTRAERNEASRRRQHLAVNGLIRLRGRIGQEDSDPQLVRLRGIQKHLHREVLVHLLSARLSGIAKRHQNRNTR